MTTNSPDQTLQLPAVAGASTEPRRVLVSHNGLVTDLPQALPARAAKLSESIVSALSMIESAEIDSPEVRQFVMDKANEVKTAATDVEAMRMDITRPIDAEKSRIMGLFAPTKENADKAIELAKRKCADFDREEARKAEQARRDAQAEADRKRREELAAAAERQRIADQEAAALRRQQEADAQKVRDAEAAKQRAIDEGNKAAAAEAERVADEARKAAAETAAKAEAAAEESITVRMENRAAEMAPAIAVVPAAAVPTKVAGGSKRKTYGFKVRDKRLMILRAAAELVSRKLPQVSQSLAGIIAADLAESHLATFLVVDEKAVGALVRSAGDQCNLPGVEVTADENYVLTGGRR